MENERYVLLLIASGGAAILDKERAKRKPFPDAKDYVCLCHSAADAKMIFKALDEYFKGE